MGVGKSRNEKVLVSENLDKDFPWNLLQRLSQDLSHLRKRRRITSVGRLSVYMQGV